MLFRTKTIATAIAFVAVTYADAGTLRVGVPEVTGDTVVLPVLLEGDVPEGVAALDFTLQYDPAVFQPVGAEAGAAAVAARKQVQSNEVSPGNYVVMMFGLNQTTVQSGQVAAVTLAKKNQPASNQSSVAIEDTALASVDGFEIASQGSNQTVTFAPPPNDGEPQDPGETPVRPDVPDPVTPPLPDPDQPSPPTPQPATPTSPGGPPAVPSPTSPRDGSTRTTPMTLNAPEQPESPTPLAGTAGRLARMNDAAQRLDSARASLNAPTASGSTVGQEGDAEEPDSGERAPVSDEAEIRATRVPATEVALAPVIPLDESGASSRVAEDTTNVVASGEAISDANRRVLVYVMTAVAIGAVLIRFRARRNARK